MIAFLWSVLSNIAATLILKPFSFIFSRWQQDDIIEAVYNPPPIRGIKDFFPLSYAGVTWRIYYPLMEAVIPPPVVSAENLYVHPTPYCPKCDTELEEKKTFFGKYLWYCCNNDFKKKSKDSFYDLNGKVLKVGKNKFEQMQKGHC